MKLIVSIFASFLLLAPVLALAEDSATETVRVSPTPKVRKALESPKPTIKKEIRQEIKDVRQETKKEVKEIKKDAKTETKATKEELRKKKIESLATRVNEANKKATREFEAKLKKLEKILLDIEKRADKKETQGRDVAAVREAVTVAKQAIASARTAVQAQAAKEYKLTSEEKEALEKLQATFKEDIKGVRESIEKARKSVNDAHSVLRSDNRSPKAEKSPVPTVQSTP